MWRDSRSVRSIPTCTRIVRLLRFPVELPCPQDRFLPDFFFWAQRPQIAGMTATQKNCAAERSRSFFAQMPKGFEDIFFEKGGNQMKTRKKWRPGGRQRQSAAYHRKAVHERKRVVRLRVWKKGEKNGVVAEV